MSSQLGSPTLPAVVAEGEAWLRRPLEARALFAWRGAAVAFVVFLLFLYFNWLPLLMEARFAAAQKAQASSGSVFPYVGAVWMSSVIGLVCVSSWCAMACILLWRRSRDRFGVFLFVSFVAIGVFNSTDLPGFSGHYARASGAAGSFLTIMVANLLTIFWFFVFPDGRFVPRWAIWVACAWIGWNVFRFGLYLLGFRPSLLFIQVITVGFVVVGIWSLVARYFRGSSEVQRNQLKWLLLCALVALMTYVIGQTINMSPLANRDSGFLAKLGSQTIHAAVMAVIPVAMFIAIFRQGLLDVDRWISRALFYSALTVVVLAAFFILSAVGSRVLKDVAGRHSDLALALLTIPLAIAFLFVRARLSKVLDGLLSEKRILSVMFIDIVDSTVLALQIGDERWSDKLERFRALVRQALDAYGGVEIDTAGDGFFATFAGPAGAIRCAETIIEEVKGLGIQVRAGVHTGEVTRRGDHAVGVAVHVGARIMSLAGPGELLVSSAVRDLVAGSRIRLLDRGEHSLKGLPGLFRVFGLAR